MRLARIEINQLWAITIIAGVFIFVNTQPIRPHDFWWHLALGREIATTRAIPSVDIYSFTMAGESYPSYQMFWLADILLYWIYSLGGPALVILTQSLIITCAYGLLLWLCWKLSNSTRIAAFAIITAIALGINNWNVRPQTISYLLGILILVAIYSYRKTRKIAWLFVPPLAMLVWVNSHGSFIIGLVMIVTWVADETWMIAVDYYRKKPRIYKQLWTSLILFGATSLVCLANPRGVGIISYVRTLTGNDAVVNLVTEWAPPNFGDIYGILFFTVFMLFAVVLAVSTKRPTFFQLITFVGFGFLALRTTRGVIWFGIVTAPILTEGLSTIMDKYLIRTDKFGERKGKQVINLTLLVIITAVVLISLPWFKISLPFPSAKAGLISSETPVAATQFLLEEQLAKELFHEMGFGSYLIWAAYPEYQVFVDPRIELYPVETWWDYSGLGNALPGWEARLDDYGFKTLMLHPVNQANLVSAVEFSPDWKLIYQDSTAMIYSKEDR